MSSDSAAAGAPASADGAGAAATPVTPAAVGSGIEAALAAARAGDPEAFAVVYRTIQPGLIRYLRVLIGADADDVASETWAQVCRDLHRFSGDELGFRGWVATIARHRAVDHARARRRRPADPVPTEQLLHLPAGADTAGAAVESLSTDAALALIATLPTEQAQAVMLRAVLGLDAATAGRVLGKRPGAVRTASHRGLKTLAARLEERA